MSKYDLTQNIKTIVLDAGFHKVGVARAQKLAHAPYLREWLAAGRHGTMAWMENYIDKREDVKKLYPDAQSVVAVAMNYYSPEQHSDEDDRGKISRYAWGKDYHKVMKKKLKQCLQQIKQLDNSIDGRICVDTAPAMDKLWAVAAGVGWQGKNTNILTRDYGSWLFLGEIILNTELTYDTAVQDYCGSCTACIEACPTDALEEYRIDARRCISYLTIEHWDAPIPQEYAGKMENWVFGCDICQDVCPWNRFEKPTDLEAFRPDEGNVSPRLADLEKLDEQAFRKRFKKSPVYRAKFHNFLRNVKTVLKQRSQKSKEE